MITRKLTALFLLLLGTFVGFGQSEQGYESKVVQTERLTVEYMDFGGDEVPLINIQGAHNFFDQSSDVPFIRESNQNWIDFCKTFSEEYHVIAPLRRGFGKTDKEVGTPTIQSHTEDLLSLMDYLNIEKAFFFGKGPASQIMLQLAENYPERVLGLAFVQPVVVFTDVQDSITAEYQHYVNQEAYSGSEFKNFDYTKQREVYRPKMFSDTTLTIDIPALYFYHDIYDNRTMWMGRIERFINAVEKKPNYNWDNYSTTPEIREYFKKLAAEPERMQHIKAYLTEQNPAPKMNAALRRAFGDNLILFNESNATMESWWEMIQAIYVPVMQGFFRTNTPSK